MHCADWNAVTGASNASVEAGSVVFKEERVPLALLDTFAAMGKVSEKKIKFRSKDFFAVLHSQCPLDIAHSVVSSMEKSVKKRYKDLSLKNTGF